MMQRGIEPGLSVGRLAGESPRRVRPRAWLAVVVALLLALSWQNFLVQTHWHAPAPQALSASHDGGAGESDRQAPGDQQPACLACIAHANATPALPFMPVLAERIPTAAYVVAAPLIAPITVQAPASPWRSRAPPALLHV
jgi:hypothetical protein